MALTRRTALATFATLSLLLLAAEGWIATFVEGSRQPGVMAIAIAADLLAGISPLYYLLLVRKRFLPLFSIAPVFVLTLLVIRFILSPSQQSLLGFSVFLIPEIELSLAIFVLFKLRHIVKDVRIARREGLYFIDALRTGLRKSQSHLEAILRPPFWQPRCRCSISYSRGGSQYSGHPTRMPQYSHTIRRAASPSCYGR